MIWVVVVVAGAAGASCRYLVDHALSLHRRGGFPWGTTAVNLSGAALLGFLGGLAVDLAREPAWLVAGASGFCGAYTTFSTWMVETLRLTEERRWGLAAANLATLAVGVALAAAGWWSGARLG